MVCLWRTYTELCILAFCDKKALGLSCRVNARQGVGWFIRAAKDSKVFWFDFTDDLFVFLK